MQVLAIIVSLLFAMQVTALVPRTGKNCDKDPACVALAVLPPTCINDPQCACTLENAIAAITCFHCIVGLGNQTATDEAQQSITDAGNMCTQSGHPVGISCPK